MNKEARRHFRQHLRQDFDRLKHQGSVMIGDYLLDNIHSVVFGSEHLEEARRHREKGGRIIAITNHFAKLDPVLFGGILEERVTTFDHTAGIASRWQFDPNQGLLGKFQNRLGQDWQEHYRLKIFQVVQNKHLHKYSDAQEFNASSLRKVITRIRREEGTVTLLCPEGTRSKIGQLLPAEDGLGALLKSSGKDVLVLPLAGIHKTILPGRSTTVIAGEPFTYQDLLNDQKLYPEISTTDLAMLRLAKLLPEENRGPYLDAQTIIWFRKREATIQEYEAEKAKNITKANPKDIKPLTPRLIFDRLTKPKTASI